MARVFAAGDFLQHAGGSLVIAAPLTMACWYKETSGEVNRHLVAITHPTNNDYFDLLQSVSATDIQGTTISSSPFAFGIAHSPATAVSNQWRVAGFVCASIASRTAYDNGVAGTPETTSVTPDLSSVDIEVGRRGSASSSFLGSIAEVAIWDTNLSTAELALLNTAHGIYDGYSALLVQRSHLKHYWRLTGNSSPEPDEISGYDLTLTGTTRSDGPVIDYGTTTLPFLTQMSNQLVTY